MTSLTKYIINMKTTLSLSFFLISVLCIGQMTTNKSQISRNSVFFEVLGQGLINSFNYERTFNNDHMLINSVTIGFTLVPSSRETVYGIPISFNWIAGKKSNHLEFGIGSTYVVDNLKHIHVTEGTYLYNPVSSKYDIYETHSFIGSQALKIFYFTPRIGYRYQKPDGGFQFRISLVPSIAVVSKVDEIKGSKYGQFEDPPKYFSWEDVFLNSPVLPWAGISFGYAF
jgi:hypothetical protein